MVLSRLRRRRKSSKLRHSKKSKQSKHSKQHKKVKSKQPKKGKSKKRKSKSKPKRKSKRKSKSKPKTLKGGVVGDELKFELKDGTIQEIPQEIPTKNPEKVTYEDIEKIIHDKGEEANVKQIILENVTEVGGNSFENLPNLETVTLPNVKSIYNGKEGVYDRGKIGENAFINTPKLKEINLTGVTPPLPGYVNALWFLSRDNEVKRVNPVTIIFKGEKKKIYTYTGSEPDYYKETDA